MLDAEDLNPPVVKALLRSSTSRNLRLLSSLDELEREVSDATFAHKIVRTSLQRSMYRSRKGYKGLDGDSQHLLPPSWDAQGNIKHSGLTGDFPSLCENYRSDFTWRLYKRDCKFRHEWGEYFRSNLDWDWDLADSLRIMYELPRVGSFPEPARLTYSQCPDANARQWVAP